MKNTVCAVMMALLLPFAGRAEDEGHRMLLGGCGLGKILLLNADKTVAWEMDDAREASDVWMLANSNILHSTKHGFQEIKPNYEAGKGSEVIWSVSAPEGSECHACQPIGKVLDNGNILFANWGGHGGSTGGAVLEVSREKKLISSTGDAVKNRVSSVHVITPR